MKIRTKIILGYLTLIGLTLAVVGYQQWAVSRMLEDIESLAKNRTQALKEAHLIGSNLADLKNDNSQAQEFISKMHKRPSSTNERELNQFLLKLARNDYEDSQEDFKDVHQGIAEIRRLDLSDPERQALERVEDLWDQFSAGYQRFSKETFSEGAAEDLATLLGEQEELLESLPILVGDLISETQREIDKLNMDATKRAQAFQDISLLLIVVLLVVSVSVVLLVVRSIHGPLRQLMRATDEVAASNFAYRLDPRGQDELASLAQSFNAMAGRLAHSEDLKRDFLAGISHDLKAPLASMQDASRILLEQIAGPLTADQRELITLSLSSGDRLGKLIADLLDLSKMEAGAMSYDFSRQDLRELTKALVEEVRPRVREEGIGLISRLIDREVPVHCDPDRIKQVLSNLLENAIKFTSRNSCIEVKLDILEQIPDSAYALNASGGEPQLGGGTPVQISVIDYGPGVPSEHRKAIFHKFHQVERERSSRRDGAGLGLSICSNIILAHQGAIWVEDNPGGGSVFCVVLSSLLPIGESGFVSDAA